MLLLWAAPGRLQVFFVERLPYTLGFKQALRVSFATCYFPLTRLQLDRLRAPSTAQAVVQLPRASDLAWPFT